VGVQHSHSELSGQIQAEQECNEMNDEQAFDIIIIKKPSPSHVTVLGKKFGTAVI